MLDSGAQISVLPSDIATDFDLPISVPSVTRKVRTFGNHQVTLRGLLSLKLDLMRAAILVVDIENGVVWSRRPESAMTGPIGFN